MLRLIRKKKGKKKKKTLGCKKRSFLNLIWGLKFSRIHSPEKKDHTLSECFSLPKHKNFVFLLLSSRYEYAKIFFGEKIQMSMISLINTKWKWFIYKRTTKNNPHICFLRRIKYGINNEQFSCYYRHPFHKMLLKVLPREKTKLLSFTLEKRKIERRIQEDQPTFIPVEFKSLHKQFQTRCLVTAAVFLKAPQGSCALDSATLQCEKAGPQGREPRPSASFHASVWLTQDESESCSCSLLSLDQQAGPVQSFNQFRFYSWASRSTYAFPHILPEFVLQQQEGKEMGK